MAARPSHYLQQNAAAPFVSKLRSVYALEASTARSRRIAGLFTRVPEEPRHRAPDFVLVPQKKVAPGFEFDEFRTLATEPASTRR